MHRMALEYVQPGMIIARDVYGADGRVILAAGVTIREKQLVSLRKWDIASVYIKNPLIEIPEIADVVREGTRFMAMQSVQRVFEHCHKLKKFELSRDQQLLVHSIISDVLSNRRTLIHLTQMHRHHNNIFSHSVNVAILATLTAVAMGIIDKKELTAISLGALLHDVGQVMVPPAILQRKGRLSPEEQAVFASHTEWGFEILRRTREFPLLAAHIAFQHHERYDGKGYPRKLAGEDIHRFSRIVAIADEYDNIVADRPGHKGLETHMAYEAIAALTGRAFDPDIVKVFLTKISVYPIGTMVKLTTGDVGVVVEVTPLMQHRPKVKIIADAAGGLSAESVVIDLVQKENLSLFIEAVVNDGEASDFLVRKPE